MKGNESDGCPAANTSCQEWGSLYACLHGFIPDFSPVMPAASEPISLSGARLMAFANLTRHPLATTISITLHEIVLLIPIGRNAM